MATNNRIDIFAKPTYDMESVTIAAYYIQAAQPVVTPLPPAVPAVVFAGAVVGLAAEAVRKPVSRRGLLGMFRGGSDDRDN